MAAGPAISGRLTRGAVALLAGMSCIAFLPSALAAISDELPTGAVDIAARGGLGFFTPSSVDPRLVEKMRSAAIAAPDRKERMFRFTPAGHSDGQSRAVTVAVRVDQDAAKVVSVRQAVAAANQPGKGAATGIAPVAFNLGIARGYESFAQVTDKPLTLPSEIRKLDAPDLSTFTPAGEAKSRAGRFTPRIELEQSDLPGRAPRTLEGQGDVSVDVGGAYRVTGNLKVTAGIRYSSERDRVAPLAERAQDSQAIYLGTQFRF